MGRSDENKGEYKCRGLADEFITNVAKKYTLDEIKIVEEEEIANMFTADFDYKLEEMREKMDNMYYYIRYNMENNNIDELYLTLKRYSEYERIEVD